MPIPLDTVLYLAMAAVHAKAGIIARCHGHDCSCYFGLAALHLLLAARKALPAGLV